MMSKTGPNKRKQKLTEFIDSPDYSRRRWQWFIAVLMTTVAFDLLVEFLVDKEHAVFAWEQLPGWTALFGFLFCLLIIFVVRFLGYFCGLKQGEDYYDDE